MRRIFAVFALVLAMASPSFAQAKDNSDVIVLLDTSESMFPYFDQVVDIIVTRVARDYLRLDDTFHLLTFSDNAQLELAQGIKSEEDVRSLISRLYLVYPFGKNTDLVSAMKYLLQYATDLPEQSSKMIVIITDGVNNPSPKSPFASYGEAQGLAALADSASAMQQKGWKVSVIRVPYNPNDATAAAEKGATDPDKVFGALKDALKADPIAFDPSAAVSAAQTAMALPTLEFPSYLGKKESSFSFPVKVTNATEEPIRLELRQVLSGKRDIMKGTSFLKLGKGKTGTLNVGVSIPDDVKDGRQDMPVRLVFADSARVSPSSGVISFDLKRSAALSFLKGYGIQIIVGFILLAIIAFVILIALMARGMPARSSATVVEAVKSANAPAPAKASYQPRDGYAAAPSGSLTVATGAKTDSRTAASQPVSPKAADAKAARAVAAKGSAAIPAQRPAAALPGPDEAMMRANKPRLVVDAKVYEGARGGYAIEMEEKKSEAQLRDERRAYDEAADREGERFGQALLAQLSVKKSGATSVQMSIDRQNPNIGLRNVHSMKAGTRLGIGRSNAFTVFVVNVPRKIAEIYFDGEICHFIPFRKDYFPELSETLHDCLDKDIAIRTPEGFKMALRLSRWVSPTDRLNKLLHIIESRGLV